MKRLLLTLLLLLPAAADAHHIEGVLMLDTGQAQCTGFNIAVQQGSLLAITAAHCLTPVGTIDPVLGTWTRITWRNITIFDATTKEAISRDGEVVRIWGDAALFKYPIGPKAKVLHITSQIPKYGDPISACALTVEEGQVICYPGLWSGDQITYDEKIFYVATLPVRPGMSGGPIYNRRGEVFGLFSLQLAGGLSGITLLGELIK